MVSPIVRNGRIAYITSCERDAIRVAGERRAEFRSFNKLCGCEGGRGKTNITGFAINIQKGPTNEFPQTLSFIVTTTNNSFFSARPAISPSGVLSFRPAPNVTGSITVNAQLKDRHSTKCPATARPGSGLPVPGGS